MFDSVMALSHHRSRRCLRTVLKIRRIAVQDCLALRLVVRRTLGKVVGTDCCHFGSEEVKHAGFHRVAQLLTCLLRQCPILQIGGVLSLTAEIGEERFDHGLSHESQCVSVGSVCHAKILLCFTQVYPSQLSGGMRQRVAIARALAANPESLLLDEPFGALDAQTRRHMQELTLQMWRKYPKTVIMVTHDVEEAILMADRVVIMSAHPGCVREVLEIDIPRPRDAAVKRTEQFRKYKKYCTDIILEESQKAEMRIED